MATKTKKEPLPTLGDNERYRTARHALAQAEAVHREAHGLVADEITEVKEGS